MYQGLPPWYSTERFPQPTCRPEYGGGEGGKQGGEDKGVKGSELHLLEGFSSPISGIFFFLLFFFFSHSYFSLPYLDPCLPN